MFVDIIQLITFGVALATLGSVIYNLYFRSFEQTSRESIEDRVKKLTTSLAEATQLISNIEAEIKARSSLAEQLQKDLDRYNQLVQLKKPEVEAVAQLLRGELAHESKKSFLKSFIPNFTFFVLGMVATLLFKRYGL